MPDPRLLDKKWRMSHLYKIRTKQGVLKRFKRNRAQEHFNANRHSRNIILKSRQLGITTDETIDTLDDCLFTKNMDALFIAHQKEDAEEIFDKKVRIAWENIHPGIKNKYKIETDRTNQMLFDFKDGNKSSFKVKVSGRSGTYQRLHVSEFAKVCVKEPKKAKEILTGSIPAVPINGRVDIEGTAEGEIGYFCEMFWEAWERPRDPLQTEFKAFFYNWTWDDDEIATINYVIPFDQMDEGSKFEEYAQTHKLTGQQITYYYLKWLSLKKDWDMLHQEYPTTPEEAFVSTGNKLFDVKKLSEQPIRDGKVVGDWIYYASYNPKHTYGVGADPSEGIGGDNATIVVIDFTAGEVVAVFCSNKISPDMLAIEAVRVAQEYGNAILAPERNNHGHAFIVIAREIYDNLYEEVVVDKVKDTRTRKYGFHMNSRSKPNVLYSLNTALNEGLLTIPDKSLVRELRTYLREDMNEISHNDDTIGHWDRVMACAIAYEMRLHADYIDQNEPEVRWDEDENHKITNPDEQLSWEEKFEII
jgi:hypothetical protein